METIRVAIAGAGTVGESTINMLFGSRVAEALDGYNIKLVRVLVSDAKRDRPNLNLPKKTIITSDKENFLENIDILVELIGGVTDAKELVYQALDKGIHVVTANKALIAQDILGLSSKIKNSKSRFGMEAAVGGGIPIINTLTQSYVPDNITRIAGILNGTCNYILTKMMPKKMGGEGASYIDAFKEAKLLGYAEQDIPGEPNPDLDGLDTRSKLAILANLSFGTIIDEKDIFMQGIRDITSIDFEYALKLGANIKLVGVAQRKNNLISYYVSPVIVGNYHEIARANGVTNIIDVISDNLGHQSYEGFGAGGKATANSVVADIINIIKGGTTEFRKVNNILERENNFESTFYIRCTINEDYPGITGKLTTIIGELGINIDEVMQLKKDDKNGPTFICTTTNTDLNTIQELRGLLNMQKYIQGEVLILPILK